MRNGYFIAPDEQRTLEQWVRQKLDAQGLRELQVDVSLCADVNDDDDELTKRSFVITLSKKDGEAVCFRKQGIRFLPSGSVLLTDGNIRNYGKGYPGLATLLLSWTEDCFRTHYGATQSQILAGHDRGPGTWFQYGYVPTWQETLSFRGYLRNAWGRTEKLLGQKSVSLDPGDICAFQGAINRFSAMKCVNQGRRTVLLDVYNRSAALSGQTRDEIVATFDRGNDWERHISKRLKHSLQECRLPQDQFPLGKVVFENVEDSWYGVMRFNDPDALQLRAQALARARQRLATARYGMGAVSNA